MIIFVVANRVCKRGPLLLRDETVIVQLLNPAPPPPIVLGDIDSTRLLAKLLPPGITFDKMKTYLEKASGSEIIKWTIGVKQSTALFDFSTTPGKNFINLYVVC